MNECRQLNLYQGFNHIHTPGPADDRGHFVEGVEKGEEHRELCVEAGRHRLSRRLRSESETKLT